MQPQRSLNPLDSLIVGVDKALRVIGGVATASRPNPAAHAADGQLDETRTAPQRGPDAGQPRGRSVRAGAVRRPGALRQERRACASSSSRPGARKKTTWPGPRSAWPNSVRSRACSIPLWYAGAYAMGAVAAQLGDARSLGFVVETERQVEAHLDGHLAQLPAQDAKSRAIVEQMRADEVAARRRGAGAGRGRDAGAGQGRR